MTPEEAKAIAKSHFAIDGDVTILAGERNPNFLITGSAGKFVLKIHDISEVPQIEVQEEALATLSDLSGFQTPATVPSASGDLLPSIGDGKFARLLTWIEGDLWSQAGELTETHKVQLGKLIATIDKNLAGIDAENLTQSSINHLAGMSCRPKFY
jgi:Ser/Thr protein kinase RdoA (MazF antagonist)